MRTIHPEIAGSLPLDIAYKRARWASRHGGCGRWLSVVKVRVQGGKGAQRGRGFEAREGRVTRGLTKRVLRVRKRLKWFES